MRVFGIRISRKRLVVGLIFVGAIFLGWNLWQNSRPDPAPTDKKPAATNQKKTVPEKDRTPIINLQPELNAWLKKNPGKYSVVMRDLSAGNIVASHDSDGQYFMASLYKLYVAYLALLDGQEGITKLEETYLNGWSRQKCIKEMIRISHSPCGEKYMDELGREDIENRLKKYGLTDTDFGAFVTSPRDIDLILARLHRKDDLDKAHAKILLDAMKTQTYDDTVKKGAPPRAIVANKVGFRELVEYHDVAIVYMPDGKAYSLSILTQNAGTRRIADLANTLLTALPLGP